jgi:predicted MFS family arabinose efflux permease
MAMCVAVLIASEFMPVSLLTPIAADLQATQGMAGQAISISGLFAVVSSLMIPSVASRFDRRHVLLALTMVMLVSLVLIASATGFGMLMLARAILGVTIGGFWALSTATVIRLVAAKDVPKALGILFTGNAVASTFAAPIGSYLGAVVGWRGAFWALVPLVLANLVWQWISLPGMAPGAAAPMRKIFGLLRRRNIMFAMAGVMLSFSGLFATFTYLRPFLETYTLVTTVELSMLLLGLGLGSFAGTYGVTKLLGRHLYRMLWCLPVLLAAMTLLMLALGHVFWGVAVVMVFWGVFEAAIPVTWSTWLSEGVKDDPESGGGLMVAAIQLSLMAGAAIGGLLLDHVSIAATLIAGAALLAMSALVVGGGERVRPAGRHVKH